MPQPVMAILSQQDALAAKARLHTADANEAGLLVGRVITRAFLTMHDKKSVEAVSAAMWSDFDSEVEHRLAS